MVLCMCGGNTYCMHKTCMVMGMGLIVLNFDLACISYDAILNVFTCVLMKLIWRYFEENEKKRVNKAEAGMCSGPSRSSCFPFLTEQATVTLVAPTPWKQCFLNISLFRIWISSQTVYCLCALHHKGFLKLLLDTRERANSIIRNMFFFNSHQDW